jgi:hypothetical protein
LKIKAAAGQNTHENQITSSYSSSNIEIYGITKTAYAGNINGSKRCVCSISNNWTSRRAHKVSHIGTNQHQQPDILRLQQQQPTKQ